jgi:uncharacterized repeat protein (TIGR01451 family)
MAFTIKKLIKVMAALILILLGSYVFAAPCDIKPSPPPIVQHNLTASPTTSVSYCELCGYGYVTIIVSNPYTGSFPDVTNMTNMTVIENLRNSGLTYEPTASNPITYSLNGAGYVAGSGAPGISGVNGSVLTFTSAQIPPLNNLAPFAGINSFSTIAIRFAVKRATTLSLEGLVSASKQIQASLTYSTSPACIVNSTVNTGLDPLPLREPIPTMTKLGRNYDANQGSGSYTSTVYGNISDDVIWRIRVSNSGMAALQDMRFDDLMQNGNMQINYACPTETAASAIALANGVGPGTQGCVTAGNTINSFVVNNPFGSPNNDVPDLIDVPAMSGGVNGFADIFLVGKVTSSCATSRTNTFSNLQWGCTLQPPAGGVTTTSTGVTPASSTAILSTLVGAGAPGLTITRQLTGIDAPYTQPVGSKGLMRITITNNSGGTIKNIKLSDVLPLEYVVDPTYTPTMVVTPAFAGYQGIVNTLTWTNPAAPTLPLTNTQPAFTLTSTTSNGPGQSNMLRHGDRAVISFRVVLIKSTSYDKVANLDVHLEDPLSTPCCTDPVNQTTLTNQLYVDYEDFCNPGTVKHPNYNDPTHPGRYYDANIPAFPEDIDIDITGTSFIITNNQNPPYVQLPVVVTNHGGHNARDYHVFVTFGATIQVQTFPSGCNAITPSGSPYLQPAPFKVWTQPAGIPAGATVYRCDSGTAALPSPLAPSTSIQLVFGVSKTTNPARIALDDLSFRADVVGEITLSNGTPLSFPAPTSRADGQLDRANNYSLDGIRARVVGFNLTKTQLTGIYCSENNPPPIPSPLPSPAGPVPYDNLVQIGEECPYHIESGGWFGFLTPGFTYIAVQNVELTDALPSGQAYVSSLPPVVSPQITGISSGTKPGVTFLPGPLTPLYQGVFGWKFNETNRITQLDEWFKVDTTSRILNCNSPLSGACASPSVSPNQQAALSTNVMNAKFQAIFVDAATGLEEPPYDLGPGTVGYPQAPARSVALTVTEPRLTVVKEVCNETLYGAGPSCFSSAPAPTTTATGDTFANYIYKITVTNEAASGGFVRAPAYDVVVTDTLDASDLLFVVDGVAPAPAATTGPLTPLLSDTLDNDYDGFTDSPADTDEGSISENNVLSGGPAKLTFSYANSSASYTHSSALQKIKAGESVTLYYRVNPYKTATAGQILTGTITATYDSLTGVHGAQSVPYGPDGESAGARDYTVVGTPATILMAAPTPQPKRIIALSNPGGNLPDTSQGVSIGEEIRYELHTTLPIVNMNSFSITDNLPVGVRCSELPPINLSAGIYAAANFSPGGPPLSTVCSDTQVQWNFGNQALQGPLPAPYTFDFIVNFVGQVQNTAAILNGATLSNGGTSTDVNVQYTDSNGTVIKKQFPKVDVRVQEPRIVLTKTFAQTTADAADQVTVTVTATNNTPGYLATAYNLQVMDDLTSANNLSYISGSISGVNPPTESISGKQITFIWAAGDAIPFGSSRTFSYKVLVANAAQPLEVLSNNTNNPMYAKWDSLPGQSTALNTTLGIGPDGSPTGLRNGGIIPNPVVAPNNYRAIVSATLTVTQAIISKTVKIAPVENTIGAYTQFEIDIALPEGTTNNLQIRDNLAAALGGLSYLLSDAGTYTISYVFQDIISINGNTTLGPAAFSALPPADGSTGNVLWNIGTVVTDSEDDSGPPHAKNPLIKIIYWARIDNTTSFNVGGVLQNSVLASYTSGVVGNPTVSTSPVTTPSITIVESNLTLGKSMTNVSVPGAQPAGLNVLEYTLTLTNTGNSTAYDINIVDTLPPALTYDSTFTPTATIGGIGVSFFVSLPSGVPAGPLVWGRNNAADGSLDLPAGQTLVIKYRVIVDAAAVAGASLNNRVYADWNSLNGLSTFKRTGVGCPAIVQPNHYCVGPAVAASTVAAPNPLSKLNTQATAAIGQQFNYHITVPAIAKSTPMYDVRVLDDLGLSAADMSYVSITQISGPAWTPQVSGAPKNLIISGSGTGLDIPASQRAVFEVTVVLNDSVQNVSGLLFNNTASYNFNSSKGNYSTQSAGGAGITSDMTIVGPDSVTLQKSGPTDMSIGTPDIFTLNIQNTGSSTAWNMSVVDKLPPSPQGMCATPPSAFTAQIFQANGTTAVSPLLVVGTDYTVTFAAAPVCTLTFTMKMPVAGIAPTNRLIISYQASLDTDNIAGTVLTNYAWASQWFSAITPANAGTGHTYTRTLTTGNPGTPAVLDHEDLHSITTHAPKLNFVKTVLNVTNGLPGVSGATAQPGDRLRYTVSLNNLTTSVLSNFTIVDDLAPQFVPGSLTLIQIPAGANATFTNATGGVNNTGHVEVRNLSLGASGALTEIIFEATLASAIDNGTTVLNQAQLPSFTTLPLLSDRVGDAINGTPVPPVATPTLISSKPIMKVEKISQDITGDPLVLMAGDTLHYIITVKNIGNENAHSVTLRDMIPANTIYVSGTTRLNGVLVTDPTPGVSALQNGMFINAVENPSTPGFMRADATTTVNNVATITFNVQILSTTLNGTIISNQGFVDGTGQGSGPLIQVPSDDPNTPAVNDPTRNIVGNNPLLNVLKTVAITTDIGNDGIVNPAGGDVLTYTITINNQAFIPATGVVLTDFVPANTTYVANTVTLNGTPVGQPDGGVSPLIAGVLINSPGSPNGVVAGQSSAVVTFNVLVSPTPAGVVISNQGTVTTNELPSQLTDADGNSSNGFQPTTIVVGTDQQLSIIKQVTVVGGGPALPSKVLEYLVRVTNNGAAPASNVVITDDLSIPPLSTQVSYVAGSASLDGSTAPAVVNDPVLPALPVVIATYPGSLLPGVSTQLRFRVLINSGLTLGTTLTNTGKVAWSNLIPQLTATASVSIDIGGVPGSANLNGHVWHDANFNKVFDESNTTNSIVGWIVNVYRNNILLGTATTDVNGLYSINGLTPSTSVADQYSLLFNAPGASATTAKLGHADSPYTNGMQQITSISALSGSSIQNLNLPITPNGVAYNSVLRTPVTGAILTMLRAGSNVPLQPACFDDPAQQGQVTLPSGYYKFDLNFSDLSCPSGGDYLIQLAAPLAFMPGESQIIPALRDAFTLPLSVPSCPLSVADAIPTTANYCEAQPSEFVPGVSIAANTPGTNYYLRMIFDNSFVPGHSQIFDNHIPVDPRLDNAVTITKISPLQNVTKGQLVPYTITVSNTLPVTLNSMSVVDTFPPGFKYVAGSGRLDGQPVEPVATTRTLAWGNLQLVTNTKRVIQLLLIIGSGVKEGKYVNKAQVFNTLTGGVASPEAAATVRVIPDPTLDCSDVIGKVFDDVNLNGYQDEGEMGLPGVRVVTARGLIVTTDKYGRFHLTCAVVPDPDRGSNFILKIDDRSLPSGYRITTENPRVLRATRGKMLKFNFGAAIHKIVKLDMADGVFEPGTTEMRVQWKQRIDLLLSELKKAASVLRLSYLAESEDESLVNARIKLVKNEITKMWKQQKESYDLTIETEVFWRTGSPPEKSEVSQ